MIDTATEGRLQSRPGTPELGVPPGRHPLRLERRRDGLLYVPPSYHPAVPAPFLLLLHGAGGHAEHGLAYLRQPADEAGLIVLLPESRRQTWDVILGGYGPDVAFLDQALARVFAEVAVDPRRLAIGGFSDGASYALSLGLGNGDLFSHILAFSPGFAAPPEPAGTPRIYVSHGVRDTVLPIGPCSRRLVPRLKEAGYDVRYDEFDGPHTVPQEIVRTALDWFLDRPAVPATIPD